MARNGLLMGAVAFSLSFIAALASFGPAFGEATRKKDDTGTDRGFERKNYLGLWVTGDGQIRHHLLANGRYVASGAQEKAREGQYRIDGDHIAYQDDSGLAGEGDFKDGILYHAGMVLYRR